MAPEGSSVDIQLFSAMRGPSHSVGFTDVRDVPDNLQRSQVDHRDIIVGRASHESARAIGLQLNTGCTRADR